MSPSHFKKPSAEPKPVSVPRSPRPDKRPRGGGQIPSSLVVGVVVLCVAVAGVVLVLFTGPGPQDNKTKIARIGAGDEGPQVLTKEVRQSSQDKVVGVTLTSRAQGKTPAGVSFRFTQSQPTEQALVIKGAGGEKTKLKGTTLPVQSTLTVSGYPSRMAAQEALRYLLDDANLTLKSSNISSGRVVAASAREKSGSVRVEGLLLRSACKLPAEQLTAGQQIACQSAGYSYQEL